MLKAYGVSHVFFMDAILRRALAEMEDVGIKRILGHSESGASSPARMAEGCIGGLRLAGGETVEGDGQVVDPCE